MMRAALDFKRLKEYHIQEDLFSSDGGFTKDLKNSYYKLRCRIIWFVCMLIYEQWYEF